MDEKPEIKNDKTMISGLIGRVSRSYPSIVRDACFTLFLREKNYDVIFNLELDSDYYKKIVAGEDPVFVNDNNPHLTMKLGVNTNNKMGSYFLSIKTNVSFG